VLLGSTSLHDYTTQHRDRVKILQLLVENEVSRLAVWCNPLNESNRGTSAAVGNLERAVTPVRKDSARLYHD